MKHVLLIASACALALSAAASADPARTAAELKALAPAQAEQVAKSDLSALLQPDPDSGIPGGHRPYVPALFTPAYGTYFEGLCQRGKLVLLYAPVTMDGKPEDRPLRPYGVEASAWFADIGITGKVDETSNIFAPACRALDGKSGVSWFPAKDYAEAAEVLLLLQKVRAQLTAAQPAWPSCDAECRTLVLAPSHIRAIIDCATPEASQKGARCYQIWVDSTASTSMVSINIKAKFSLETPGDIESVTANEMPWLMD